MTIHKSYLARLSTDEATAKRIAAAFDEALPEDAAVALFAERDGRWAVELHFSRRPDVARLRTVIVEVAGAKAVHALWFSSVAPRDWVKASLEGLRPVAAGRFVVHGEHDRDRVAANALRIEVEAALAFGTGHHGTTRGCLLALDALVKRGAKPLRTHRQHGMKRHEPRAAVLDLGTGSGVLAIAAAKAWRLPVLASEIDAPVVKIARQNARHNGTAPWITLVQANGLAAACFRTRAPYDLVLANILLAPLQRLAAPLRRVLAPGARVILSGLLPAQANAALASYRARGLVLERRIDLDGWTTLVMLRPKAYHGLGAHHREAIRR